MPNECLGDFYCQKFFLKPSDYILFRGYQVEDQKNFLRQVKKSSFSFACDVEGISLLEKEDQIWI
ncbi:hypothetical protein CJ216_00710 [Gardnerella greenwoodii]|uniref:Uncharacterized protein n=1 Tax=Gardnerella greenwoodii TaxID=2914925 RepID=A0A2N6RX28_9BIFI|nr:hypothetical protein CJ216_00710 [Gardnerella greenwoodii]